MHVVSVRTHVPIPAAPTTPAEPRILSRATQPRHPPPHTLRLPSPPVATPAAKPLPPFPSPGSLVRLASRMPTSQEPPHPLEPATVLLSPLSVSSPRSPSYKRHIICSCLVVISAFDLCIAYGLSVASQSFPANIIPNGFSRSLHGLSGRPILYII